jgi:hypothetical protein
VVQVALHLASNCKSLSSNPCTTKKKKKRKERKKNLEGAEYSFRKRGMHSLYATEGEKENSLMSG